jgi:hypothetical protein
MDQPGDELYLTVDGYWFQASASASLVAFVWPGASDGIANGGLLQIEKFTGAGAVISSNYPGAFETDVELFGNLSFLQSYALPDPFNPGDLLFRHRRKRLHYRRRSGAAGGLFLLQLHWDDR